MFRKQQAAFEGVVDGIVDGLGVKIIDIVATPGAGKSTLPIQACRLIKAGLADAILWFVPRAALQDQGERGFFDPFFRELFNHNFLIRSSTNEINPCRGTKGFITTYQAVGVDTDNTILNEVRSKRYIIVLDEFHHLEQGGVWHKALAPIVEAGHFLIKMTGTLGRGDKKKIAYVDYKGTRPHFKDCDEQRLIIYSRIDALKEKAILPIEFHLNDGEFRWLRKNGEAVEVSSFKEAVLPSQKSEALFTALNSEFAGELLRSCVIHWSDLKKKNPGAKLLVVTADYEQAKRTVEILNRSIGVSCEIATSHESKAAHAAIKRFRAGACQVLVTIAMAYEGLDVPEITHIGVLTNIRTREWIEQMLARGVRIDKAAGPYETQRCYVFAPMDSRFKKVVGMIKNQQIAAIEYFADVKKDEEKRGGEEEPRDPAENITPISSIMTGKDQFLMGIGNIQGNRGELSAPTPVLTIKEQEIRLRKEIQAHVNRFCAKNRYDQQQINTEIMEKFGKARKLMTLKELTGLAAYVIKYYPAKKDPTLKNIPGLSLPRGGTKRVTSKVVSWTPRSEILKQSCYDPIRHLLKK